MENVMNICYDSYRKSIIYFVIILCLIWISFFSSFVRRNCGLVRWRIVLRLRLSRRRCCCRRCRMLVCRRWWTLRLGPGFFCWGCKCRVFRRLLRWGWCHHQTTTPSAQPQPNYAPAFLSSPNHTRPTYQAQQQSKSTPNISSSAQRLT